MTEPVRPFFSIVIPTYNRFERVRLTIESALAQTFRDFEVLVIDDGSTDQSFERLTEIYRENPRIRLIRQENLERGAARNNGIRQASGTYIQFIDSDDIFLTDHLSILAEKIKVLDKPDFICTKFEFIRDGRIYPSDIQKLPEAYYDYRLFLSGNPLACNVCIRKENPDLYYFAEDRKYAIKEDWMFLIQNLFRNRLYIIDKVSVQMNDHEGRSMRTDNRIIISKTLLARDWILKNLPLTDPEKDLLESHVAYFSSIHSYLDDDRKQALNFLKSAVRSGGMKKKHAILFLKIIAGRNLLNRFRGIK